MMRSDYTGANFRETIKGDIQKAGIKAQGGFKLGEGEKNL